MTPSPPENTCLKVHWTPTGTPEFGAFTAICLPPPGTTALYGRLSWDLGLGKNLDYSPGRVKPRPDMAPQFPFEDRRLAGGYPWKRRLFSWGDRAVCVGRGKSE